MDNELAQLSQSSPILNEMREKDVYMKRCCLQRMAHNTIMRSTPRIAVAIITIRAIELLSLLNPEPESSSVFVSK